MRGVRISRAQYDMVKGLQKKYPSMTAAEIRTMLAGSDTGDVSLHTVYNILKSSDYYHYVHRRDQIKPAETEKPEAKADPTPAGDKVDVLIAQLSQTNDRLKAIEMLLNAMLSEWRGLPA